MRPGKLLAIQDHAQPVRVGAAVKDHHTRIISEQPFDHPDADEAVSASHKVGRLLHFYLS